jgi:hypothetical protein
VAVTGVAAADQNAVGTGHESFENQSLINPARAHYSYNSNVGGIFQAGGASQVSPGVGAPVTKEADYFWLKFAHYHTSWAQNYSLLIW